MLDLHIGRHGLFLLLVLFLLLGTEDILIWVNTGTLPAVEFFLGMVLVLGVFALAIHEAVLHPP